MRTPRPSAGYAAPLAVILVYLQTLRTADGLYRIQRQRGSGCADGTSEGLYDDARRPDVAACGGKWSGHVRLADGLCAPGWGVCSWEDQQILKKITWSEATTLDGCFAFNAAQDGGHCRACIDEVEQDDMAGVGKGCPHQSYGQKSCISGGQISASCCVDTHYNRSCVYRPGLTTGVLCCRRTGLPPQILVSPPPLTHVTAGTTFVLSCQALGAPVPVVSWYKDGYQLPGNEPRIAVFPSGYMVISSSRLSDHGMYRCIASNTLGNDTTDAQVIVTDHPSGCADHTTDALHQYEYIQGCQGRWAGHVKRGRRLCAKGWKVCSSRDTNLLSMLTWDDVTRPQGCYAYNAENKPNQCDRCHRGDTMAGIGAGCGRIQRNKPSCLTQGRVDVYRTKDKVEDGCAYTEGSVKGVLCCKSRKKKSPIWERPKCSPRCDNGGLCIAHNRCVCDEGYKGAWCQNAICPGGCIHNATCVRPGVCRCKNGYTGDKCKKRRENCLFPCMNGGRCKHGKCKCPFSHYGDFCQYALKKWKKESDENNTER